MSTTPIPLLQFYGRRMTLTLNEDELLQELKVKQSRGGGSPCLYHYEVTLAVPIICMMGMS